MIPVATALERVLNGLKPLPAEEVDLTGALGRVLAEDVASNLTQPRVAVSAMDGYAVRGEDVATVPVTLTQIGESAAGGGFDGNVGAGETVRIFTGAPLPSGADTIVIQENTEPDGASITVLETAQTGRFVRPAGLDFSEGEVHLRAGQILNARDVGLAAAMNVPTLKVRRKPRIGLIATGNEVVMPGAPLGPTQIVSSNTFLLIAAITAWGGEPVNLGIALDDEASLTGLIRSAADVDLLVTIGGASVGDYDFVGRVLDAEGVDLGFYKVAMRPGKPLIFGHLHDTPVLGLPGNPVSVGVTSAIFLRPAIRTLLGETVDQHAGLVSLPVGESLAENDERQDYLRATFSRNGLGETIITPFTRQDSSMLARFSEADGLIVRAPFAPAVEAGDMVEVLVLGDGRMSL